MAFRLLLLMAMGLGAMYMMHLLAQDYNKIRKPVAAATRALVSSSAKLMRVKRRTSELRFLINRDSGQQAVINETLNVNWKRILSRDTFGCLESLICQLMSGAESTCKEAILLKSFIEYSFDVVPAKLAKSFVRGIAFYGASNRCFNEYPFCLYSAKTMLRILKWFSDWEPSDKSLVNKNIVTR